MTSSYGDYTMEQIEKYKDGLTRLTEKELPIFNSYILKKSQKTISSETGLELPTIKWHIGKIYKKLGVSSRKELIEINNIISNK